MATPKIRTAGAQANVTIVPMSEHDLLEVVEIEELSGLSPWGWEAYHKELQSADDVIMLVASRPADETEKFIAGFIVARLIIDELHINNIAVHPDWRRLGIGAKLLHGALRWGREKGASRALLEVRAGNIAAQALYLSCGFEIIGRRRRYYRMPVEDALLMSITYK